MFKEFLKEQYESFVEIHHGITDDIMDSFRQLNLRVFGINLLAIILLSALWVANLFLYTGSAIVVGSMILFKYCWDKIRKIFNG